MKLKEGGQTFSKEGCIEHCIATGDRVYYIYNYRFAMKTNKNILHQLSQNEGNNSDFRLSENGFWNETCGIKSRILI